PCDHGALPVGERDDRVVERRLDVRLAERDVLPDAAPSTGAPARRRACLRTHWWSPSWAACRFAERKPRSARMQGGRVPSRYVADRGRRRAKVCSRQIGVMLAGRATQCLPTFLFWAIWPRLGPFRPRALVFVRCPRT